MQNLLKILQIILKIICYAKSFKIFLHANFLHNAKSFKIFCIIQNTTKSNNLYQQSDRSQNILNFYALCKF